MEAEDRRWIVIDGRRWRATDPNIPEPLRKELVSELMSARRAVKAGEADARPRVHDAKVALGERGDDLRQRVESATRALLRHRAGGTVCPSEVARIADGAHWRSRMPLVREVAAGMAGVVVLQRGEPVDAVAAKGPVRLGFSR